APKEDKKAPEKKEKKEEPPKKEAKKPEEPKKEQAETEKPASAKAQETETAPPREKGKPVEAGVSPASEFREKKAEPERPSRPPRQESEARVKASPVARRIAAELGVDLGSVKGTGPEGRVTETDVRAAAKKKPVEAGVSPAPKQVQLPLQGGSRIQLSGMRKGIAERLVQSKAPVPHFYLNIDIDAGPLMEARAELKSAGEDSDTSKITVNDFVLKAAVMAAVKVPKVNASFDNDAIVQYPDVDLGIAVAIEDGLLTP